MSDIHHFENISYVSGGLRVEIRFDRYEERYREAQQWLGDRVLEDCKACMPHLTGGLQQRSHVENEGRNVVFPGPTARYLYGGVVMVDSVTGKGPMKIPTAPGEYVLRFRLGAKLVATSRPLTYSNPQAVPHWFDEAKQRNGQFWIDGVKEIIGGK